MKTLVLCVDRDNDIGIKTGLRTPLVGRDENLAAATRLGLADPEDSDVNALLSAVSIYDGLQKDNADAEVATICGDVRVGSVSDLVLTKQLDQVLDSSGRTACSSSPKAPKTKPSRRSSARASGSTKVL